MKICETAWTWPRMVALLSGLVYAGGMVGDLTACKGEESAPAVAFEPGDISIGEPIPLPFGGPKPSASAGLEPGATSVTPIGPPREIPRGEPTSAVASLPLVSAPGQGWLGLAVTESSVPGRWIIDEVAPVGPAAAAGLLPGDEVRGINGMPLRSADEVSQALTAIAPGQEVGMAIARGEQVRDVHLTATARPAAASRLSQVDPHASTMTESTVLATVPPSVEIPQSAIPAAGSPVTLAELQAAAPFAAAPPMAGPDRLAPPAAAAAANGLERPPRFAAPRAVHAEPSFSRPEPLPGPSNPPAMAAATALVSPTASSGRTALGVRTLPIDEGLQARFGLAEASGAYVIGVVQDLPASRAGVPPGSVIVSLNDRPVRSPNELTQLVTNGPVGRPVTLEYVLPGGTPRRADVVLQTLEKPLEEALTGKAEPTASGVPSLELGQPTTARRPAAPLDPAGISALRDEIQSLRAQILAVERQLEATAR